MRADSSASEIECDNKAVSSNSDCLGKLELMCFERVDRIDSAH